MKKKVTDFIKKHNLLMAQDNVIVALSGGADSMALFHFLCAQRQEYGITLLAAHLNHGLRGAEAERDENFVRLACQKAMIPLFVERAHMQQRKPPSGMGIEAFARELRYHFLLQLADENKAKIATAHTLTDNAETVLFHAIRGAGPKGLAGIAAERGLVVRPLLGVSRAEVEAYCAENGIEYMTDSTNLGLAFTRNRLRLQVFPLLEDIHEGAAGALVRMAGDMRVLDDWLSELAKILLQKAAEPEGYSAAVLLAAPAPVRLQALAQLAGRTATRNNLACLEQVLQGKLGATTLPSQRRARLVGGVLQLRLPQLPRPAIMTEYPLQEGAYHFGDAYKFRVKRMAGQQKYHNDTLTDKKGLTFWADYDKIDEAAVFRTRRTGDRFALPRRAMSKSIKKWMIEEGIPAPQRGTYPLLCTDNTVLWAYSVGFCDEVCVTDETYTVLQIQLLE